MGIAFHLFSLTAALLLDRMLGEPQWLWRSLPHPVAIIGSAVAWFDRRLNDLRLSPAARRWRGVAALAILVVVTGLIAAAIHLGLRSIPFGMAVEVVLVAVLLAQKSLIDHVRAVARALSSDGVPGGRQAVALIVGRDVTVLDEAGVARAAIESAAENFSDGLVAPAFWYAVLGLPGLLIYKTVNTADSMIGHRTERYKAFGWAAARTDDLLNFVPARLSALLIAAAALTLRRGGGALAALRDAPRHKSPNAGWPEAALAGALGLALGGPRRYGEIAVDGAWLNAAGRKEAGIRDIDAAVRQIDLAWGILVATVAIAGIIAVALAR